MSVAHAEDDATLSIRPAVYLYLDSLRALVLFLLGVATCSGSAGEGDPEQVGSVGVSVEPVRETFTPGEALRLRFRVENGGTTPLVIDLGTSDVDRLALTWIPAEGVGTVTRQGAPTPGIAARRVLHVPAGGSATHVFLLNKLITPDRPGDFVLRVRIRETTLPEASTTVRLRPPLGRSLEERYAQVTDPGAEAETRRLALEDLVYTRTTEALPFQEKLLDNQLLDTELTNICLASMLVGNQDEAVRDFVGRLTAKPGNQLLPCAILFALKSYGWSRLSGENAERLKPFRREILEASPVEVSD